MIQGIDMTQFLIAFQRALQREKKSKTFNYLEHGSLVKLYLMNFMILNHISYFYEK